MNLLRAFLISAALACAPLVALAQDVGQPFTPISPTVNLAVTSSTGSVAITQKPADATSWNVAVYNAGSATAYVKWGGSTVTVTAATGYPIPAGATANFVVGSTTPFLAAITSTGTTTVYATTGFGVAYGYGGGGASSGSTAVTIADGADVAEGAVADAAATAGGVGTVSAKLRTLTSTVATYNQSGATAPTSGVVFLCANQTSYVAPGNGQVGPVLCTGPSTGATGSAVPAWASYTGGSDGTNLIGIKETANALWGVVRDAAGNARGANVNANSALLTALDQTTPGSTNGVVVNSQTTSGTASVSFTSGTTAYAANDVVGASGANAALTFTAQCPASGNIMITGVQLEIDAAAVISGSTTYILYFYNVTPPSALNDSTAWDLPSGDRASFLGGGTAVTVGPVVDLGSTVYAEANGINKQLQCAASGNLFAYLVSVGAYTPLAQVYKVTIHSTPL